MIDIIEINEYREMLGKNPTIHNMLKPKVTSILHSKLSNLNIRTVSLYNIKGEKHSHNAGRINERVVIFINGTAKGAGDGLVLDVPEVIGGVENKVKQFLAPKGDGIIIVSEKGIPLAEWRESTYELNILFDLFAEGTDEELQIFEFIMQEFNKLVWYAKTLENSWVHSKSKEALISRFTKQVKDAKQIQIVNDKRQVERYENDIQAWARAIKEGTDKLGVLRRSIEVETANLEKVSSALLKDMDLIVANPKVKDLHVKDGKFIIYTNPLHIHADTGRVYYGGEYRIEIKPDNTDIRFFGDNTRKSYWTDHDPHPHVNGNNGQACLGNISSTVAELCSQMQIYALTLIGIDFLESANTSDSAGKNVVRWDEVKADGTIEKKKRRVRCPNCEELVTELFTVYEGINVEDEEGNDIDPEPYGEHRVCQTCRDDDYYYDENAEVYAQQ